VNLNFQFIAYFPLIFVFLQSFMFYFTENNFIPASVIVNSFCIIFLFLIKPKFFFEKIITLYKYTPFKYLVILYLWIFISGLLCLVLQYITLFKFVWAIIVGFVLRLVFIYFYSSILIPKIFNIKTLMKVFVFAYFTIFIIGFIEFVGVFYGIEIINNFIHFISNIRKEETSIIIDNISNIPRIRSVCMEPGTYGRFIAIQMPLIYQLVTCKYKIFKSSILNKITKITLIPMLWISLLLTQSPIYLVICTIVTILFFYKHLIHCLLKNAKKILIFAFVIITFICIFIFASNISFKTTFINRIIETVGLIKSFSLNNLIIVEPSLATRVVNNLNQFLMFLKHPITGIGLFNNGPMMIKQFETSGIPLTPEMTRVLIDATSTMTYTTNALYSLLHQTGLFGAVLYILFAIKSIKFVQKLIKYFSRIEKIFLTGFMKSVITLFSISIIYNQDVNDQFLFFMFGLCSATYFYYKKKINIDITYTRKNTMENNAK